MFGDVGDVEGVTGAPLGELGGVAVDPGTVVLFGLVGEVVPLGGVAVEPGALVSRVDVVGVDVPGDDGVEVPGDDGVAVPGDVVELGVLTVPSDAMQGVELPGAVVPGRVLGGMLCVPGAFCVPDPFCGVDVLGVVPVTVPEPLFIGEHGGKLPGVVEPGTVEPGPVDPGAVVPGIAVPGVGTAG